MLALFAKNILQRVIKFSPDTFVSMSTPGTATSPYFARNIHTDFDARICRVGRSRSRPMDSASEVNSESVKSSKSAPKSKRGPKKAEMEKKKATKVKPDGDDQGPNKVATKRRCTRSALSNSTGVSNPSKMCESKPSQSKKTKKMRVKIEYEKDPEQASMSQAESLAFENVKLEPVDSSFDIIKHECVSPIKTSKDDIKVEGTPVKGEDGYFHVYSPPEKPGKSNASTWEPPRWREQYANITQMRKFRDAPVDSMGCDVISDNLASPQVSAE